MKAKFDDTIDASLQETHAHRPHAPELDVLEPRMPEPYELERLAVTLKTWENMEPRLKQSVKRACVMLNQPPSAIDRIIERSAMGENGGRFREPVSLCEYVIADLVQKAGKHNAHDIANAPLRMQISMLESDASRTR